MPTNPKLTAAEQLTQAQVAIDGALADSAIAAKLAQFGYPSTEMNAGRALLTAAQAKVAAQDSAQGARVTATQAVDAAMKTARDSYQSLAEISRAAFASEKGKRDQLGLTGTTPARLPDFLARANTLFTTAQTDAAIKTALARYGYDAAKLTAERGKIDALATANVAQEAARGAAQTATQQQTDALKALRNWLSAFTRIARVALKQTPQDVEKLGIAAKNIADRPKKTATSTPD